MTFNYNILYNRYFEAPLIFSCLFLFFFIVSLINLVNLFIYVKKYGWMKTFEKPFLSDGLFLLFSVFELVIHSAPLFRGGIYLIRERASNAIVLEGTVEDVQELNPLFGYSYSKSNPEDKGEAVYLNGGKYYILVSGCVKTCDHVIVKVLPKSKLILSIKVVEDG